MRNKSHRNLRKKRCGEKISYLTREDACHNMILLSETANNGTGTDGLSVYRCKDCSGFHVGHTPQAIRERYQLT